MAFPVCTSAFLSAWQDRALIRCCFICFCVENCIKLTFFLLSKKKNFLLDLFYCDKVGFSVLREVLFLGLGRYIKSCRDGVEAPFVDSLNQKSSPSVTFPPCCVMMNSRIRWELHCFMEEQRTELPVCITVFPLVFICAVSCLTRPFCGRVSVACESSSMFHAATLPVTLMNYSYYQGTSNWWSLLFKKTFFVMCAEIRTFFVCFPCTSESVLSWKRSVRMLYSLMLITACLINWRV